jgi:phosphate transport system substrate-binding protein
MRKISSRQNAISTVVIAVIVIVIIIVAGVGAYVALSGTKSTTTTTSSSSTSSVSTTSSTTTTGSMSSTSTTSTMSTTSATSTLSLSGTLNVAGSTLVFPLMSSWTFAFGQLYSAVTVNYASVGSGQGIASITAKTVDIGASDAPLSSSQYAALPATVVTIPESISAVIPAYNLPGINNGLNFTGNVLAEMFLGNITMWNDPAILGLNPGMARNSTALGILDHAVTIIHRSDGSGTMYAFTNYLTDSNAYWAAHVGYSTTPPWPTGIGCKGNEGVAGCIENTQYSLGPLEIAYQIENPSLIHYGKVENAAGNFILANSTNIGAAVTAGASVGLPAGNATWTPVSIINNIYNDTSATNAYPVTTFTYLITYQKQTSSLAQAELVVNFLWWVVNKGQQAGASIGYIPLPANVQALDNTTIQSITYNGQSLTIGS